MQEIYPKRLNNRSKKNLVLMNRKKIRNAVKVKDSLSPYVRT